MGFRSLFGWIMVAAFLVCPAVPVRADELAETRGRVAFQVERSRAVSNDRARSIVGVTAEDVDPVALAGRVQRAMAWGLEKVRGVEGVRATSGGYRTSPVYQDGRLRRWRASQDLVLEGTDLGALTTLLGALQERLQVRGFDLFVSDGVRRVVQDELIAEALAAFRARAAVVQKGLDASGWHLADLSIQTPKVGSGPRPRMLSLAAAGAPPVAVEGGASVVAVTVRGSVVLE